ncbi:unnamed protein product [Urochloa decumbens]|uniref:F-box domain-containing protein n=1 Tax=Urochloa decumbens TaxID=240449 RepID=A0ABC9F1T3_9POAL
MAPPELMEDLVGEILLRLPPDEPEHLFRAALVCKPWLRILTNPEFGRRYRSFHGAPPLLGLLHRLTALQGDPVPRFASTTSMPDFPHPSSGGRRTRPLDCRHGRVLVHMLREKIMSYLVWDPVTGDRHAVPKPTIHWLIHNAGVFCAADGCDHLDCHGGPFRVVFMATDDHDLLVKPTRAAVIRDEIYFTLRWGHAIVKYDGGNNCLSMIDPPPHNAYGISLMVMDDSSLGFVCIEGCSLHLWSRKVNSKGSAEWVQCQVIDLKTVIPVIDPGQVPSVVGSAEGVGAIFISTDAGLFTIELKSGRWRKLDEPGVYFSVLPYMSFYTPDRCRLLSLANMN